MTKKYYDRKSHLNRYKVGDAVIIKNDRREKGTGKLTNRYSEQIYYVVDVLSDVNFRIAHNAINRPKVVHHDRMKPFHSRDPTEDTPDWVYERSRSKFSTPQEQGTQTCEGAVEEEDHSEPNRKQHYEGTGDAISSDDSQASVQFNGSMLDELLDESHNVKAPLTTRSTGTVKLTCTSNVISDPATRDLCSERKTITVSIPDHNNVQVFRKRGPGRPRKFKRHANMMLGSTMKTIVESEEI